MDSLSPEQYDAWYDTPRGRWMADLETALLARLLKPEAGQRILDVGCGTGWFTRRLAQDHAVHMTGVDIHAPRLAYAKRMDARSDYLVADALQLPFADGEFDCAISVTALDFIADWPLAVQEMMRVTRRRLVLITLNRNSLLWWHKGRGRGSDSYAGAHWRTAAEMRRGLSDLGLEHVRESGAILMPGGSMPARLAERWVGGRWPWHNFGSVLAFAADLPPGRLGTP
ncbi:MAG: class I SAM-dependent methyltransferase [Castellaniella sp.]